MEEEEGDLSSDSSDEGESSEKEDINDEDYSIESIRYMSLFCYKLFGLLPVGFAFISVSLSLLPVGIPNLTYTRREYFPKIKSFSPSENLVDSQTQKYMNQLQFS
jgi:hypothetical protein